MKKKIRLGTFETNSSSVHSLVISKEGLERPNLRIKRKKVGEIYKRFIYVPLQTFDKYNQTFYSQEDKLSYPLENHRQCFCRRRALCAEA